MGLIIENITKSFENKGVIKTVLKDINLKIKEGEFLTLLGPSGCGKTTLLTIIAGFQSAETGSIYLEDKIVSKPGPDRGFVFQDYALFPWMTVGENIIYPLKIQGVSKEKREKKLEELLNLAGLKGNENLYPYEISGGMKQRTAFVRALGSNPKVLLMDEPLGAIDFQMRHRIQKELEELWLKSKKTVVMVTHDIDEALFLSDRIIVMSKSEGKILGDLKINLKRSRDRESLEYLELKKELTSLLEKALKGNDGFTEI
ncbi:ABC transporter ATP-binding protein SaoA [Cetobacterium ceti]